MYAAQASTANSSLRKALPTYFDRIKEISKAIDQDDLVFLTLEGKASGTLYPLMVLDLL